MVAIGRERKIVVWDLASNTCDQKISKGQCAFAQQTARFCVAPFALCTPTFTSDLVHRHHSHAV